MILVVWPCNMKTDNESLRAAIKLHSTEKRPRGLRTPEVTNREVRIHNRHNRENLRAMSPPR